MNILMLNYEYPPLGGGGGVAAANLAAALVRKGHRVDYITTHYEGLARREKIDGVRLFREPVWGRKDLHTATIVSMLSYPTVAFLRGRKLMRRNRYDLIHTHFAIPTGPAGWLLSKWSGLPNVLTVYGGDIYDPSKSYSPHRHPVLHWAVKKVLAQADVIIPESEDLCRLTREFYQPATPIRRIPLGFVPPEVPPASREELGLDPGKMYAIAVSRLIVRKAYPDLLRAFHRAAVEGLELLILGDGPQEAHLRDICRELGIESRVHFLGYRDDQQKFQYLSAADFFVLTPLHEGFGIVFQEAMFSGLPIVTTNVGGQTDFLAEGRNALLAPPGQPEAMAEALRRMAQDAALRQTLRENNLHDIQGFMIDHIADQYLEVFENSLSQEDQRSR